MPDLQVINRTPHTLMTTHEIVRDLASFKMYKKNVLPMHPSDQPAPAVTLTHQEVVQIEFSLFLKGWHPLLKHHRHELGGQLFS